jgi:hypothetical protein
MLTGMDSDETAMNGFMCCSECRDRVAGHADLYRSSMKTPSASVTAPLRVLSTVFAAAAVVLAAAGCLSSDAMSSTSASNGTINIGTHPPNALLADPVAAYWQVRPYPPHTPIIKG